MSVFVLCSDFYIYFILCSDLYIYLSPLANRVDTVSRIQLVEATRR